MVAIDLGSNTLRIVKYDCVTKQILATYEKIVRTADGLIHTNKISDEAIERIIEALKEAKQMIEFEKIKAYATQAMRMASNKKEVIQKIKDATNVEFQIISAQEEAYYTAIAAHSTLKQKFHYKNMFLVDIGGGSTELILHSKKGIISESFEIGIVTISQKYKSIEALEYGIRKDVKPFRDFINFIKKSNKIDIFCATSGTPTTIAALKIGLNAKTYNPSKIDGIKINLNDLDYWQNELLKMGAKKREEMVGVGRGDLIVSGIMIFKEIFRLGEFDECVVCDAGLREGIALEYCKDEK
jgi:exopolyphosphatase/guanosine-5'-triphosphate,3'-diphosphate pyrophosphatase